MQTIQLSLQEKNDLMCHAARNDDIHEMRRWLREGATALFRAYGVACLHGSHGGRRCEDWLRKAIIQKGYEL